MTKFKDGDIVYHVTNDKYKMQVTEDYGCEDDFRECSWLDKKGKYRVQDFYVSELTYKTK